MKKARGQKIAAIVLVSGGGAMFVAGALIHLSENLNNLIDEGNPDTNKGLWLCYVGGAAMVSSIPFFIMSHNNKKKALSLTFENQTIYQPALKGYVLKKQPAIGIRLAL